MKHLVKLPMIISAFFIVFLLLLTDASAAPAYEKFEILKQPSGETFKAMQQGDEYFNYIVSDADYVIIKGSDGYWVYAVLNDTNEISASDSRYLIDAKPDKALKEENASAIREKMTNKPNKVTSFQSTPRTSNNASILQAVGSQKILVLIIFRSTDRLL